MSFLTQLYSDVEKYKQILANEIDLAEKSSSRYHQLGIMAEPDRARIASQVYTKGVNRRLDLIYPTSEDKPDEQEEIVLKLQGYAAKVNLPPITSFKGLPRNIRSLKQSILLSGLGLDCFEKYTTAVMSIHQVLGGYLPAGALQGWTPISENGYGSLDFGNRYFSTNEEADDRTGVPLNKDIDPFNILSQITGKGIHTEDNEVLYFERREFNKARSFKYSSIAPTAIREGHMLELQVSFAAIPINKGRFLMLSKLRSVCIIGRDAEHDHNQQVLQQMRNTMASGRSTLKRTVGYKDENDEEEITPTAFKRLRLNNDGTDDNNMFD